MAFHCCRNEYLILYKILLPGMLPFFTSTYKSSAPPFSWSFFSLPWWQMQVNALSSSPRISPCQTNFSCGSRNPSWPAPLATQAPSYWEWQGLLEDIATSTSLPTLVFHIHMYKRPFTSTHLFLFALIIHRSPAGKAKNHLRISPEAEQGSIVVNSRKEFQLETTHKKDKRMIFQKPRFPLN